MFTWRVPWFWWFCLVFAVCKAQNSNTTVTGYTLVVGYCVDCIQSSLTFGCSANLQLPCNLTTVREACETIYGCMGFTPRGRLLGTTGQGTFRNTTYGSPMYLRDGGGSQQNPCYGGESRCFTGKQYPIMGFSYDLSNIGVYNHASLMVAWNLCGPTACGPDVSVCSTSTGEVDVGYRSGFVYARHPAGPDRGLLLMYRGARCAATSTYLRASILLTCDASASAKMPFVSLETTGCAYSATERTPDACPRDYALGQPARSSGTDGTASSAVTRGTNGTFIDAPLGGPTVWEVDLGGYRSVSSVVLYPRTDCCQHMLRDLTVVLLTGTPSTVTDTTGVVFTSQLLNPDGLDSPSQLWVDVAAANNGSFVNATWVRVVRSPAAGGAGTDAYALALGMVTVYASSDPVALTPVFCADSPFNIFYSPYVHGDADDSYNTWNIVLYVLIALPVLGGICACVACCFCVAKFQSSHNHIEADPEPRMELLRPKAPVLFVNIDAENHRGEQSFILLGKNELTLPKECVVLDFPHDPPASGQSLSISSNSSRSSDSESRPHRSHHAPRVVMSRFAIGEIMPADDEGHTTQLRRRQRRSTSDSDSTDSGTQVLEDADMDTNTTERDVELGEPWRRRRRRGVTRSDTS